MTPAIFLNDSSLLTRPLPPRSSAVVSSAAEMIRSGDLASGAMSRSAWPPTRSTMRSTPSGAMSRTAAAAPSPEATNVAPVDSTSARLDSEAIPMTLNWCTRPMPATRWPTPPPAPRMSRVCPASSSMSWVRSYAVEPARGMVAATWKEMFSGLARTSSTRRTAWSAKPPSPSATKPMTSSPTAYASTPVPTATTVPETSKPRARGSRSSRPNPPSRSFTSAGFTPAARTSTTISPAPGSGTGRSISSSPSGPPYWLNTYARDIRTLLGVVLTGCLPCGVGRPGGRPTPALGSGWLGGAHLAGPCRRPGARAVARSIERASTVAAQEPHRVGDDDQHGHLVDEHPDGHRHTAEEDSGEQCRHRDQRDHDVLAHVVDRAPRQRDRLGQLEQVVLHQRDVGRLNGYAGAGRTHRHADVRSGQCRRVVHAVTHHRHCVTLP